MFGRVFPGDGTTSSYYNGTDPNGAAYWQHQAERHRQHRRSVVALLIAAGVILLLALIVHPVLAWGAAFLVPFLALESWQVRRTSPTSKIPDYRRPDTVEVPLDP